MALPGNQHNEHTTAVIRLDHGANLLFSPLSFTCHFRYRLVATLDTGKIDSACVEIGNPDKLHREHHKNASTSARVSRDHCHIESYIQFIHTKNNPVYELTATTQS